MDSKDPVFNLIEKRRSVRSFLDKKVSLNVIHKIIKAGGLAPSGHNNQPWSFVVIKDVVKKGELAKLTVYGAVVNGADTIIAVFLDKTRSYNRDKDMMAIGACIQNILLYSCSLGIGTVWLGEILKNKEKAGEALNAGENKELTALIALGYPEKTPPSPGRMAVNELIEKEY